VLSPLLIQLQKNAATTLAAIGYTIEALLPHLAMSPLASQIPATNPLILVQAKTQGTPSPFPGLPTLTAQPSHPFPPNAFAGGQGDAPYLPSDNSPPRTT